MTPLICINSSPSLINDYQLIEGKKYHPFFFMQGFDDGQILVGLREVPGMWDYDRFLPESIDFQIEQQLQEFLK